MDTIALAQVREVARGVLEFLASESSLTAVAQDVAQDRVCILFEVSNALDSLDALGCIRQIHATVRS